MSETFEEKTVAISCKNGEIIIIRINHPMKLNLGSKRISGMPKFTRSELGSDSNVMVLPHKTII